jgi:arylsulfatase A-like enzyme
MTSQPMDLRSFGKALGIGVSCVALWSSLGWSSPSLPPKRSPNIVLILIDDQGYADLGCYGAPGSRTPNIDRLAAQGMRFTDFYVSEAVCSASRASLLTGCYAERVGISGALNPWAQIGLNPEEETIADLLKARGYATGIIGKWHLGHLREFLPLQQGFDEYFGLPYSNDMWPMGFDGKPTHEGWKAFYPPLPLIEGNNTIREVRTLDDQATLTALYTQKAVDFISRHRSRPFFLYLAHAMVHVPLGVSEKYRGKSSQGMYADVTMEVDWSVGEVMKVLKENGLEENTLVIYASDNGPWLNMGNHAGSALPLREGKGTAFEGGARVPCIMRWPAQIPPARVCSQIAATIDILPTICAVTETALPRKKIDGVNILPLLREERDAVPRAQYYFYYDAELRGVRRGQWKLYFPHLSQSYEGLEPGKDGFPGRTATRRVGLELYDLSSDIGERTNVAAQHPDIVDTLKQAGEQARNELGDRLTGVRGSGVRLSGRKQVAREATQHLALAASLTFAHPYDRQHNGGGDGALVDGKHGSLEFADGLWQGFEGVDLDVVVDLQNAQNVKRVTCGLLESQYSWIFLPSEVEVAVSMDGKRFQTVWSTTIDAPQPNPIPNVREVSASFEPVAARFVHVVCRNLKQCPSWHPGAGGKTWIFADEIEVR